ncbi:hypothetical protein K474DRAFT_268799 [Panus rudis PR-1116 ss-1]|nr:hypothetical protein K474DRAFT_268799 [Panus rudis PR-1116 ss-1]
MDVTESLDSRGWGGGAMSATGEHITILTRHRKVISPSSVDSGCCCSWRVSLGNACSSGHFSPLRCVCIKELRKSAQADCKYRLPSASDRLFPNLLPGVTVRRDQLRSPARRSEHIPRLETALKRSSPSPPGSKVHTFVERPQIGNHFSLYG